jgi:hypothetical protein
LPMNTKKVAKTIFKKYCEKFFILNSFLFNKIQCAANASPQG